MLEKNEKFQNVISSGLRIVLVVIPLAEDIVGSPFCNGHS